LFGHALHVGVRLPPKFMKHYCIICNEEIEGNVCTICVACKEKNE